MRPEADRILKVFRDRGKHTGDFVHPADFGDAIVWKDGFICDEAIRLGFCEIVQEGYVVEHPAALQLTARGDEYLYPVRVGSYGAKVYRFGEVLLVKQTVLRGTPPEYVAEENRERQVPADDGARIAQALRDAVGGLL